MMRHDRIEIDGATSPAGDRSCRSLAAAVIYLAIADLTCDANMESSPGQTETDNANVLSALDFLFGPDDLCAGYAGMINFSAAVLRRRIVESFEAQKTIAHAGSAGRIKRRKARLALARIRAFVWSGAR